MEGEGIDYIKCRGRKRATIAARDLRAKYAQDFDELSYVEIEIVPAGHEDAPDDDDTDG